MPAEERCYLCGCYWRSYCIECHKPICPACTADAEGPLGSVYCTVCVQNGADGVEAKEHENGRMGGQPDRRDTRSGA